MSESINYSQDDEQAPKSTLISRNITVLGRRTSVRLEPEMWMALREIAQRENCSIHDICTLIFVRKNDHTSLTAAIRVFLMLYFRASSTDEGHRRAGHGDFDMMIQRARMPEQYLQHFKGSAKKTAIPHYDRSSFASNEDERVISF